MSILDPHILNIYSSLAAAVSVKPLAHTTISATRKANTAKSLPRREFFINVESHLVTAPELPDSFRPLIEAILIRTLQDALNTWRDNNPLATSIDALSPTASFLSRPNLLTLATEGTKSAWLSSEELTNLFDASSTWKRVQSSDKYKNEATYRAIASAFRDLVIRLAAKNLTLTEKEQDTVLAKLDESDMASPLGEFVAMRIDKMRNKPVSTLSLDDL